jgi:Photosynthesis system II assembly factor YCF48
MKNSVIPVIAGLSMFAALAQIPPPATSTGKANTTKAKAPTPAPESAKPRFKAIWEPVNYKEDLNLTDVFFTSDEVGWVTGEHGTILHTKDGGNTWTPQQWDELAEPPTFPRREMQDPHASL